MRSTVKLNAEQEKNLQLDEMKEHPERELIIHSIYIYILNLIAIKEEEKRSKNTK